MAKYLDSLPADAPGRYLGKTAVIGTLDPSTIDGEWWSMDPEDYTQITYIDMGNYFVLGSSPFYSMAEFKNNKSLQSYDRFVSGWLRNVEVYRYESVSDKVNIHFVVHAMVNHSQRMSELPVRSWFICRDK